MRNEKELVLLYMVYCAVLSGRFKVSYCDGSISSSGGKDDYEYDNDNDLGNANKV